MTIFDGGNQAIAFVSMVLTGRVVRLNLNVSATGVTVASKTVIAEDINTGPIRLPLKSGPPAWYTIQSLMCFMWHPQKTMPCLPFRTQQREATAEAEARLFTQMLLTCTVRSGWQRLRTVICSLATATSLIPTRTCPASTSSSLSKTSSLRNSQSTPPKAVHLD